MGEFRILIVDDDPWVRRGLRMLIERHDGWTVCGEAADGLEAVQKAADLQPGIILLDVSMPRLDGLNALPLIRKSTPDAKVLILTLHESLQLARAAADRGAQAFIAKSLAATNLISQIEELEEPDPEVANSSTPALPSNDTTIVSPVFDPHLPG